MGVAHFPSCVVQAMVTNDLAFATQLRIRCHRGRVVCRAVVGVPNKAILIDS